MFREQNIPETMDPDQEFQTDSPSQGRTRSKKTVRISTPKSVSKRKDKSAMEKQVSSTDHLWFTMLKSNKKMVVLTMTSSSPNSREDPSKAEDKHEKPKRYHAALFLATNDDDVAKDVKEYLALQDMLKRFDRMSRRRGGDFESAALSVKDACVFTRTGDKVSLAEFLPRNIKKEKMLATSTTNEDAMPPRNVRRQDSRGTRLGPLFSAADLNVMEEKVRVKISDIRPILRKNGFNFLVYGVVDETAIVRRKKDTIYFQRRVLCFQDNESGMDFKEVVSAMLDQEATRLLAASDFTVRNRRQSMNTSKDEGSTDAYYLADTFKDAKKKTMGGIFKDEEEVSKEVQDDIEEFDASETQVKIKAGKEYFEEE